MNSPERIIVAIDLADRDSILRLSDTLGDSIGQVKIGLEAFVANGPAIVDELIASGRKVFLDLKFHDIPNTARGAVAAAARSGVTMMTLHASGGTSMMRASAEVGGGVSRPLLLGVTILTSLETGDLHQIGIRGESSDAVVRLALLAKESSMDGVVSSPREITLIREACGPRFLIVTPGIRASDDVVGDQKRTLSAREAVAAGADYLVIGRPITRAHDPKAAATRIAETIG